MDLNSTEKLPHLKTINNTLQNRLPLGHGGQLSPGQGSWWIVHRLSFERYSYFRGISSWLSKVMQAIYKWKWFHVNVLTGNSFYFLNQILWVNCKWVQAITERKMLTCDMGNTDGGGLMDVIQTIITTRTSSVMIVA